MEGQELQQTGNPEFSDTVKATTGQVSQEIERQSGELDHLHRTLNDLESRLNGILEPEVPPSQPSEKGIDVVAVQVAQTLRMHNASISEATRRVASLIARIEL